jgi:hypothetical protein
MHKVRAGFEWPTQNIRLTSTIVICMKNVHVAPAFDLALLAA